MKNQELEKFKYVLDYKIYELQRLIEPRDEEIERMKNQLLKVNFRILRFRVLFKWSLIMKFDFDSYSDFHLSFMNERKLKSEQFLSHCLCCSFFLIILA